MGKDFLNVVTYTTSYILYDIQQGEALLYFICLLETIEIFLGSLHYHYQVTMLRNNSSSLKLLHSILVFALLDILLAVVPKIEAKSINFEETVSSNSIYSLCIAAGRT